MATEDSRFQKPNKNTTRGNRKHAKCTSQRNRKHAQCTSQRNRKYVKCISSQYRKPANPVLKRDPDKRTKKKVGRIQ